MYACMWLIRKHRDIALALPGGGVHGAFSAGVLDRLLENGVAFDRVSGVSSGALIGTALTQGWAAGGAVGARRAIERLWQRIAEVHAASGITNGPLARWLWGVDVAANPLWQGVETALRLFSPEQLNPLGHNPLRPIVSELLDPGLLTSPAAPCLTIAATDVETGVPVLFRNADITVEALLASACLPFLFSPVEIDGHLLWDGAYSANPPLKPLLEPDLPEQLVLIRTQPQRHPGRPTTQAAIFNRQNEIAFQRALEAQLVMVPRSVRLRDYEPDTALAQLPLSSKLNAEENLVRALFASGRETARLREVSNVGNAAA